MIARLMVKFTKAPKSVRWGSSASCKESMPLPQSTAQTEKVSPYQVCKERHRVNEAQLAQNTSMRQQTQPGHMPEYYNPGSDLSRVNHVTNSPGQQQQQRTFTASKTYRSLTMPLKSSRLASPFPEPVKLMPSCQVSDQEKAQRMYNDSRLPGMRH